MSERRRPLAPLIVLGVTVGLGVLASAASWRDQGITPVTSIGYAIVGALIARRTGNRIGWLLQAVALLLTLTFLAEAELYRSSIAARPLAGAAWAALANQVSYTPMAGILVLILLVYPTGRLPSRRWEGVGWILLASTACATVGLVVRPGSMNTNNPTTLINPLGIRALGVLPTELVWVGFWGILACAVASLVAIVSRSRRASGDPREQIRWLAYVGMLGTVLFLGSAVVVTLFPEVRSPGYHASGLMVLGSAILWGGFALCVVLGIPAAMAFAILKYRLYDIDLVIRKTVVLAMLALFVTAVYAVIVAGIGAAVGRASPALSFAAAVVVAIAFQPVRGRARLLADRLVYGKRATPYEVLTEFSEQAAEADSTEDVLPHMARIVAEGTGARRALVWLRVAGAFVPSASWPADDGTGPAPVRWPGDGLPPLPASESLPVLHGGTLLGAISVDADPADPLTPVKSKIIRDVAAQAGLVLRNVQLLEDLKASRRRIVAAQDEERRRIQRSLRDGAERQLVDLGLKLRDAEGLARVERAPEATEAVRGLRGDTESALANLRALARGVYPPLLEEGGIVAALDAQANTSAVPIEVQGDGIGRYPIDVEAAVYFCSLEALQNAVKYADASTVRVRLVAGARELTFEVADDGRGFDPAATGYGTGLQGMADRLAAIGGALEVRSAPGQGTTVSGTVRPHDRGLVTA